MFYLLAKCLKFPFGCLYIVPIKNVSLLPVVTSYHKSSTFIVSELGIFKSTLWVNLNSLFTKSATPPVFESGGGSK